MKTIILRCVRTGIVLILCVVSAVSWGSDMDAGATRILLKPNIITALKRPVQGKAIIMCEVSVTTANKRHATFVEHFQPQLRDALIDLLNQSTPKQVLDPSELAQLEDQARIEMNRVLQADIHEDLITKVTFETVTVD